MKKLQFLYPGLVCGGLVPRLRKQRVPQKNCGWFLSAALRTITGRWCGWVVTSPRGNSMTWIWISAILKMARRRRSRSCWALWSRTARTALSSVPIDPETQTDFLNNLAANTLLVCADSDAAKSQRRCYIGTDNVAAGMQAAELLKAALPQGGKIILFIGYPNAENTQDRAQGIQKGLAGSNIQIVDTLCGWRRQ